MAQRKKRKCASVAEMALEAVDMDARSAVVSVIDNLELGVALDAIEQRKRTTVGT
jgi:hypothetical protein